MENQNTTANEPQNDIYELLQKVVETNEENIKSTKQTEVIHLEARDFYQSAQNAIFGSTDIMQKAMQLIREKFDSITDYQTSIPESIPADLSEDTVKYLEDFKKTALSQKYLFLGSIGLLILAAIIIFNTSYFAMKWYSERIRTKTEVREEILSEIKDENKAIYETEQVKQLEHNTTLMNKWMKKNPKDAEKFLKFKEGYESR